MELVTGTATVEDLDSFVADLGEVGDRHDCAVQAFDARYVAGPDHLERAVELADRAIDRGENVARDRAVEILLYAAGRRQIDRALEMGVSEGETPVVVVIAADRDAREDGDGEVDGSDGGGGRDGRADDRETDAAAAVADLPAIDPGTVEFGDPDRIRAFFEVTGEELSTTTADLADLVLERVALLDVEK